MIAETYDLDERGEAMAAHPFHRHCAPDDATEVPDWSWDSATACEACGEPLGSPAPRPDADPTDEPRPFGWADILPTIATYDRIVRGNRSATWDTLAAVVADEDGEDMCEVFDVAEHELGLSLEMAPALDKALRDAVRAYRVTLAAQLAAEGASCTCETDEDACPLHLGNPCPSCGRRHGHDDDCKISQVR